MSVQALCPTCGSVAELHRVPVGECAHCHTRYPEPLRQSAERALARARAPKPVLIALGQWCSLCAGLLFLFFLLLAPFGVGTYTIGEELVSGPEFLRRAGWLFGAIGCLLLAIGVALWKEWPWARPLMVAYWGAVGLVSFAGPGAAASDVLGGLLFAVLGGTAAAWYLYRKPNVRAYFEGRNEQAPSRGGV